MNAKRCKHGMIEDQCGVCKKWEDNCWEKKEEKDQEGFKMDSAKGSHN
jgi:hypothetical protein